MPWGTEMDDLSSDAEPFFVLTIDDDREAALTTKRFLEKRLELVVDIALDADAALRKLAARHYEVVLMDTVVSGEPGCWLLESIAELLHDTSLVIIAGRGDAHMAARLFEIGASGYVVKDGMIPRNLLKALESAMMEHSMKRVGRLFNQQHALADAALDNLQEIFIAFAGDYSLIKWNNRLLQVSGYDDNELCCMSLFDLFDEEGADRVFQAIGKLSGDDSAEFEACLAIRNGFVERCGMKAIVHTDSKGEPASAFLLATPLGDPVPEKKPGAGGRADELGDELRVSLSSIMIAAETLQMLLDGLQKHEEDGPLLDRVTEAAKLIADESERAVKVVDRAATDPIDPLETPPL